MTRVIQIRDVPDDVHAALRDAAEARGVSLTKYMLDELQQLARRAQVVRHNSAVVRDTQVRVNATVDSGVTNALRRLVLRNHLTEGQGAVAMQGFYDLTLDRYPADGLRPRMWTLRHNLSAYDATYLALAEALGASALLTTDARLAKAPGIQCSVVLL